MNWVFISLILATAGQWGICGFSLPIIVAIAGRVIFLCRILGATVSIKISRGFEIAALFLMVVGMIFTKQPIDWLEKFMFIIFSCVAYLLMVIDDRYYLYVVSDYIEEEEEQ